MRGERILWGHITMGYRTVAIHLSAWHNAPIPTQRSCITLLTPSFSPQGAEEGKDHTQSLTWLRLNRCLPWLQENQQIRYAPSQR